jgi:uncharacterized membrane protein YvbJ
MMFCANCGARLEDGKKFCGDCGAKVEDDLPQAAESSAGNTAEAAVTETARSAEILPVVQTTILATPKPKAKKKPVFLIVPAATVIAAAVVAVAVSSVLINSLILLCCLL